MSGTEPKRPAQRELFPELRKGPAGRSPLAKELAGFSAFGTKTVFTTTVGVDRRHVVDTFVNEFWTSTQRAGNALHEVSYRACFKPQLPEFFIRRLTEPGDVVYDPFAGRGTTPIEAALLGRVPHANDVSPLSVLLVRPRLLPPTQAEVEERLAALPLQPAEPLPEELLVFYHEATLAEICALREYLLEREAFGTRDAVDDWIRMVAINRLTGHSVGYFSVYSLPPNQAVSVQSQRKINEKRGQVPPRRDVRKIIAKKSRALLSELPPALRQALHELAPRALLTTAAADATTAIPSGSVQLVVTSPPFLDVVQYATDNWLRCWFCGIDGAAVPITMAKNVATWQAAMQRVFVELHRVVRSGGHVAFEVGEVKGGTVRLEEAVLPAAAAAGFVPELVLINEQEFTKTANCWGIDNNQKGTNSNRIVLLRRP